MSENETGAKMDNNPYLPPAHAGTPLGDATAHASIAEGDPQPHRRFRWRTIPATLSWFVSAAMAIGLAASINDLLTGVPENDYRLERNIFAASIAAAMFVFIVSNLVSGLKWMAGRWVSALALNIGSWGVLVAVGTFLELYFGA